MIEEPEPPLTKETITLVNPFIENGSSALLLGGSSTGKTTLLVQAITNILKKHKNRYDMIILFSEAISSIPLRDLPDHNKIIIFKIFIPQLVKYLMNVNQAVDCRYSILFILDDVILLKNPMIDKLILVARNFGISTIISTQKLTGLSPGARASIHNSYILGGRNPEIREEIIKKYLKGYIRERGITDKNAQDDWLRENTRVGDNERKLIKMNGITDQMSIHTIKK